MKLKAIQESTAQKVVLHGDDPKALDCMMDYFYKLEYPEQIVDVGLSRRPRGPLAVNALVFAIADKYICPDLKAHAAARTIFHLYKEDLSISDLCDAVNVAWGPKRLPDSDLETLLLGKFLQERKKYLEEPNLFIVKRCVPRDFLFDLLIEHTEVIPMSTCVGGLLVTSNLYCDGCGAKKSLRCRSCRDEHVKVEYCVDKRGL